MRTPLLTTLLLITSLITGIQCWAQFPDESIQSRLEALYSSSPQEKIFLHHTAPSYLLGGDIWFKIYLTDAQWHEPSALSGIAYVELIGPGDTLLVRHQVAIQNGGGEGDFSLSLDWEPGPYRLRAYTHYMRNYDKDYFFETSFPIYKAFSGNKRQEPTTIEEDTFDYSIQFFPEGGDAVGGLPNRLGIKSLGSDGLGLPLSGEIYNETGQVVANFQTHQHGLGSCTWKPAPGQTYVAETHYQGITKRFALPTVKENGHVIKVEVQDGSAVVQLYSNHPSGLTGTKLVGHSRGRVFLQMNDLKGNAQRLLLPLSDLPEGVATLTLFDAEGRPVAERMMFIHQTENRPLLSLSTNQDTLQVRSPVRLTLDLKEKAGKPIPGEVSVSVYKKLWKDVGYSQTNILSYLLLSSDLTGYIENPNYYFEQNNAARRTLLDQLLMTQGWRRFLWTDVLSETPPTLPFPNESAISFGGMITKPGGKKGIPAEVFLTIMSDSIVLYRQIVDENGRFYFDGQDFRDTTTLSLRAGRYNAKKDARTSNKQDPNVFSFGPTGNRYVEIQLDDYTSPPIAPRPVLSASIGEKWALVQAALIKDEKWRETLEERYNRHIKEISLEEVVIEGRRNDPRNDPYTRPGQLYSSPDYRLILDSIPGSRMAITIFDILRSRVPGIQITGSPGQQNARFTRFNSLDSAAGSQILLDGNPIDNIDANTLNINDIEYIDVLQRLSSTSIYGQLGGGGVIAIYTRDGRSGFTDPSIYESSILEITHPGFYQAREFYSPDYESPNPNHRALDLRTPLYWSSKVLIGKDGKAEIVFFTGDQAGHYCVEVQGIGGDVQPILGEVEFVVE